MKLIFSIMCLWLAALVTTAQDCEINYRHINENQEYTFEFIDSSTYSRVQSIALTYERQVIKPEKESEIISKYSKAFPMDGDCNTIHDHMETFYFGSPVGNVSGPQLEITYEFVGTYCDQILIRIQGWDTSEYFSVGMNNGTVQRLPGKPITYNCATVLSYGDMMAEAAVALVNLQSGQRSVFAFTDWEVTGSKETFDELFIILEQNSIYCAGKKKYVRFKLK